jgi:hypothetical protein
MRRVHRRLFSCSSILFIFTSDHFTPLIIHLARLCHMSADLMLTQSGDTVLLNIESCRANLSLLEKKL